MADKLTPQQAQAVFDRGGNLLVSAAAGSGKTKVLVDRLLTYLTDPVSPANLDEFLIITYTKAAAAELRGKIAAKLTERIAAEPENRHLQKQMQRLYLTKISTVHGFCADLLREYAYRLDLPADFRVADENECQEIRLSVLQDLLDRAYTSENQDEDFRTFLDTQGLGRDDRLVPDLIQKVYDSARCHLDPEEWLSRCISDGSYREGCSLSETTWGQYLIEDLDEYLGSQIAAMKQCVADAMRCDGLEKQAQNLQETVLQLEQLMQQTDWDEIVRCRKIDFGRLVFPKKNPDPELAERIKAVRNACKKGLEKKLQAFTDDSDQVWIDMEQCAAGTRGLVNLVRKFDQEYRSAKLVRRVLDFGDLEHNTLDLLIGKSRGTPTVAAREIGRRFREIMVDEYQDSNGVQDAIFCALTQEKKNCFMVGDVKQSIYQFRLADPGIFLDKYQKYIPAEEAAPGEGRKVFLSHNFRSGPEVVSAVNDVFSFCMSPKVGGLFYGEIEALREGVPHSPLPDSAVELHILDIQEETYAEEAEFVANRIQEMLKNGEMIRAGDDFKPVEPEDIVILLRSPNSIGRAYQKAVEAKGLRCYCGAGEDFLDAEEISMLISFLQVIVNPRQDIPLISTLASPVFGFTADDLAQVRSRQKKGGFYDALQVCGTDKANAFLDILTVLRKDARQYSLTQLLERCFSLTRLDSVYGAMQEGESKQENLQTFFQLAAEFEQGGIRDLGQFLQHLEALKEKGIASSGNGPSGCIQIMSIHKSKGLEFPVVFLCGLSRAFNRESVHAQILCDKDIGIGMSVSDSSTRIRYPSAMKRAIMTKTAAQNLSEEMRVLYVAMTRARDRLIMTYSSRNLEKELCDLVLRMGFDGGALLCQETPNPGRWVLLEALRHIEAGELHAIGGRPKELKCSENNWKICVTAVQEKTTENSAAESLHQNVPEELKEQLISDFGFQYGHVPATKAPSKQTATDRKGRIKDMEAASNAREPMLRTRQWRKPSFISDRKDGRSYGNALHAAMQYIRYENCKDLTSVRAELRRMYEDNFLSDEQYQMLDADRIYRFFQIEIGKMLCAGVDCLREFKFSILDEGSKYGQDLTGEKVLLQGVVDCAILEADGITIVDFKTDNVNPETAAQTAQSYRLQIETYAEALSRIYDLPIKACYLYFFKIDQLWMM